MKVSCAACGEEFELLPSELAKKRRKGFRNLYCSKKCASIGARGTVRPETSRKMREAYQNGLTRRKHPRTCGGVRPDLGIYMRSSWEINFARVLSFLGVKWEYEPETFIVLVDGIASTYTPDFYLPEFSGWVEVKGRWLGDARKKLNSFAAMHPITILDQRFYRWMCQNYYDKIEWEGKFFYGP